MPIEFLNIRCTRTKCKRVINFEIEVSASSDAKTLYIEKIIREKRCIHCSQEISFRGCQTALTPLSSQVLKIHCPSCRKLERIEVQLSLEQIAGTQFIEKIARETKCSSCGTILSFKGFQSIAPWDYPRRKKEKPIYL
ncbi:MAG: hypothetical protein V1892_03475 [bacterium]